MSVERVARISVDQPGRPTDDEIDLFGITHQGLVRSENQDKLLEMIIGALCPESQRTSKPVASAPRVLAGAQTMP